MKEPSVWIPNSKPAKLIPARRGMEELVFTTSGPAGGSFSLATTLKMMDRMETSLKKPCQKVVSLGVILKPSGEKEK